MPAICCFQATFVSSQSIVSYPKFVASRQLSCHHGVLCHTLNMLLQGNFCVIMEYCVIPKVCCFQATCTLSWSIVSMEVSATTFYNAARPLSTRWRTSTPFVGEKISEIIHAITNTWACRRHKIRTTTGSLRSRRKISSASHSRLREDWNISHRKRLKSKLMFVLVIAVCSLFVLVFWFMNDIYLP